MTARSTASPARSRPRSPSGRRPSASSTASPRSTRRSSSSPPIATATRARAARRGQLRRLAVPGPRAARAGVPVRARDLDAGHGRRRARRRRPARHPHQGRRAPRAGPPHRRRRRRQDGHAHPRPARSSPTCTSSTRPGSVDDVRRLAASIDAASEHPVAHAIVGAWDGPAARRHRLRGDPRARRRGDRRRRPLPPRQPPPRPRSASAAARRWRRCSARSRRTPRPPSC